MAGRMLMTCLLVLVELLVTEASRERMDETTGFCPDSPCHCQNTSFTALRANCSNRSLNTVKSAHLPSNIVELLMDHNNITALNRRDFAIFQNLTFLDLSSNGIQHLDGEAFAGVSNLKILNLENNSLELSELSTEVFSSLVALDTLKLNNNPVQTVYPDAALSKLLSLKFLSIDGMLNMEFDSGFRNLSKLTTLVVSGAVGWCNVSTLTNSSLRNVPHVEFLDVSFCNITKIEPEALLPLHNLRILNITGNYHLGFRALGSGMEGISENLTNLVANNIVRQYTSCVVIKQDNIKHLKNTSLTHLYLDDNSIEGLDKDTLPLLPKTLEYISAQRNKFSYGTYLWDLHTMTGLKDVTLSGVSYALQGLDLDDEDYLCPYSQCDGTYDDRVLEDFDVLSSMMQSRSHWPGEPENEVLGKKFNVTLPPNLETVHFNFTQLTFKIGELEFKASSLKYLDLSSNLVQFQRGQLRGLENVTRIDLSNNLARKMSRDLFLECEGLEHLDLSYNFFGWQIYSDTNGSIFHNLPNLQTLVLTNNDLPGLTGYVLNNLNSLKTLNISKNGLFNFSPVLTNLSQLTTIDASDNQIKWLSTWMMRQLTMVKQRSKNFTLILRRNALVCDCQNLDTLQWLYTSKVSPPDMTGYYCLINREARSFNTTDQFKAVIDDLSHQCKNNFGLALGCFSVFIAAIGLMVGAILYRYRWKLRYLYYAARLRYMADNAPEEDDSEFLFDAFVSYADEDRGFVINDMRARLEHESSMTLNIHHRDFMPGEPIVSNIVGAIKKSRKMLVLLSPNFLKSYWCKYELHMAQMESISTGRDIIIVIMYESVSAKNIPPEFIYLLQSDSYIEYPKTESDVAVFWSHLNAAIRRKTNRLGSQSSQA